MVGEYQIGMMLASGLCRAEREDPITPEWRISEAAIPSPEAVAAMEERVRLIRQEGAPELVWLLEHPPLYTAGTSADPRELGDPGLLPVYPSGRGGRYTYHGPGQRIAYVMLDLKRRGPDIRRYVHDLESWIIAVLGRFGVTGERRTGRIGIWVDRSHLGGLPGQEDKIAAIGVRVRSWVSFHGLSLNVDPDLRHYAGIIPCGIADRGVTSLHDLGHFIAMPEIDSAFKATFDEIFNPQARAQSRPF